jgi:hypothetical protein
MWTTESDQPDSDVTPDSHELPAVTETDHESAAVTLESHEPPAVTQESHELDAVTPERHESDAVTQVGHETDAVTAEGHAQAIVTESGHALRVVTEFPNGTNPFTLTPERHSALMAAISDHHNLLPGELSRLFALFRPWRGYPAPLVKVKRSKFADRWPRRVGLSFLSKKEKSRERQRFRRARLRLGIHTPFQLILFQETQDLFCLERRYLYGLGPFTPEEREEYHLGPETEADREFWRTHTDEEKTARRREVDKVRQQRHREKVRKDKRDPDEVDILSALVEASKHAQPSTDTPDAAPADTEPKKAA